MSKELKTGIVLIIIIVGFIWGFNFLKGQDFFKPNKRFYNVEYTNVGGLTEASLVTINGLKVGKVEDIDFNDKIEKRGHLVVRFSLENDFEFSQNSVVKIYSPNPLSGSNLAIIPNFTGEPAVSGDFLKGEIESSLFTSIGEKLDPIQAKLENVIVSADTLFKRINSVLDKRTSESIKRSVKGLEFTIVDIRKTLSSVNSMIDSSSVSFKETLVNTKNITENLLKVTDTLANSNIGEIIRKAEISLTSVNSLLKGMDEGKGTLGKLINDDAMYNNLTNVSKELEYLLREIKLNPKRFVHFSLFGKRAKSFNEENNKNNKTNQ
ncbi:phospholipid/cholesterol/gamma-HCH transport system substrate-binding protein [Polaribacter sp. Hel1_33_78]|jgi:phospholipid/cholesterol/gamma-HCH transport system substrate-binding protein|uniref:MlaD family protein n=1 Tax=unclassified Polaribacter TaxID=196858 RepID=UPI00052CADC1|nr:MULTISPECIES: MlaD family protein [unclassified Polaribacter]KGL60788.1 MCE family protein [Polaribacter sp. Hel1_33_49]MBT3740702.1 MCE family protein [Polaribacter sp.]MDG1195008.1 MlaD family protein [Polaribacter sp.]MDG1403239.1 MlaD family protein [Polaribacter sp.]MDG2436817.1 MlaD family protein [Polaribacter sp.]